MTGPTVAVSEERNVYVDWARAASICIVVIFHTRLYSVTLADGQLGLSMWDPNPILYPISWVLMAIPVFFIAGGYGHSVNMLKADRLGTGYGEFLAARARRLIGPTIVFITIFAVAASVMAATGSLDLAVELTRSGMSLLWFITVYLVVTALAPMMVRLHERAGPWVFGVLAGAAAIVDGVSFALGDFELRNANLLFVWLFVHQLGIAYHRGWFRSHSVVRLLGIALLMIGLIGALIAWGGYPAPAVGFASVPIANVQPPTIAMAILGVAQTCALALFERAAPRWANSGRALTPVRAVNALLMTVYLWHLPVIVAVTAVGWVSGVAPLLAGWQRQLLITLLSLVVIGVLGPLIARMDVAMIPPLGSRPVPWLTVLATVVIVAGVSLVWRTGLVVHPTRPLSTAGVFGVWLGWALLRRALGR